MDSPVYVLTKGDVEYDRCPRSIVLLMQAIADRKKLGQITNANIGEWQVFAIEYPHWKRRSLTLEERAALLP